LCEYDLASKISKVDDGVVFQQMENLKFQIFQSTC